MLFVFLWASVVLVESNIPLDQRILFRNYVALLGPDLASKLTFNTVAKLQNCDADSQTLVLGGIPDERTSVNVAATVLLLFAFWVRFWSLCFQTFLLPSFPQVCPKFNICFLVNSGVGRPLRLNAPVLHLLAIAL